MQDLLDVYDSDRERARHVSLLMWYSRKCVEMREINLWGGVLLASVGRSAMHLAYLLVHMIDAGKTEEIETVRNQLEQGTAVRDLIQKYGKTEDFSLFRRNGPYSAAALDDLLTKWAASVNGQENKRYVIRNNGLSLVLAYALEVLRTTGT